MSVPGRERRRGFTLIEMLVVIAVIGVLAGLLLPALLGAKERGYTAYCENNLHNLAMAMRKYCALYDGHFPDIYDGPWYGVRPYPVEYMAKMMGVYTGDFSKGGTPPKVVLCPSCKASPADGEDYLCRHYAINGHLDSWPESSHHQDYETRVGLDSFQKYSWGPGNNWGYWANFQPYRIEDVRSPERVAVFADSVDEVDPGYSFWCPYYMRICATVCYRARPTRHQGGGNVAFLDGHVQHLSRSYFQNTQNECQWLVDPDTSNGAAWWDSNFGS